MDDAVLLAVRPYDLHGVRWYQIAYAPAANQQQAREARISHDLIYPDPQPGDRVRIRLLLGIIDQVERNG